MKLRRRFGVLGAAALCAAACGRCSTSATRGDPSVGAGGHTGTTALAVAAARSFLDAYALPDGRVQRTDQGGDTVSEGQAYGMLAAAAIGERRRFDAIWSWTRANLRLPNGLFAFWWAGGRVVDAHPATDADLDVARALLVAACRFGRPGLRAAAVGVGRAVLAHETARAGTLDVLLAGPWATHGGYLVFNPSYVDPTTLRALARAGRDGAFRVVAASGTRLVDELTRPLPPDWAIVDARTGRPTPVSGASSTAGPGMFTYDAPRTLVRFAASPDPADRAAAARAWSVFSATRPRDIVTVHALSGAAVGTTHSPVTLVAVAGAARAAGDGTAAGRLLAEAQTLNAQHPTYYGSAWVALGRLLLTTTRLSPCASP